MIRTPFAALVAVSIASPALAAQGICEFVTDRGAPLLPPPAALMDVLFRGAVERAVFEPGTVEGIPIARWLEYPLSIFVVR